ncbi:MAG TPA: urease subunit alpha [Actinomycetes bacterium]|nr:urease subunit alpha [Actinomycetes bacterium]
MKGAEYSAVYGPTAGDLVTLGDTGLVVRVESDAQKRHDEFLMGFGKTARDGMHLAAVSTAESCDLVVSNVLLIDPIVGIRKVSIGVREGRISALGRAGNPDTLDDVDVVVGNSSAVINGEGLIATPGVIDTHVHTMSPRIMEAALSSGVTTILGQEFGPVWGVGVNSPWGLGHAFRAFDDWPVNIGFLGRGSSSQDAPLREGLDHGGVCGFKVHEDTGAHPRALDTALKVAEEYDVQVALHTDGLNESLSVEDTLEVIGGRTIHAFHVEGCGGGHVPNVLQLAGVLNVIGSSTNPTLPYGRDAIAEHLDMIIASHGLKPDLTSDVQMAVDRIRDATMAGENVLHDLGVIPITSSDAQGMGRAGETVKRTFALAAQNKRSRGPLEGDDEHSDNTRVLRYLAKLTINPAIAHGFSDALGSLEVGKVADIVLWEPAWFGAKPSLVLKSGFPAWGLTGDPNATVDRAEPLVFGPQFGAHGATPAELSYAIVSQACNPRALGLRRPTLTVHNCRGIGLNNMIRNTTTGTTVVDADGAHVAFDGEAVTTEPVESVSLSRLYFL